jgi:hypothetical protein
MKQLTALLVLCALALSTVPTEARRDGFVAKLMRNKVVTRASAVGGASPTPVLTFDELERCYVNAAQLDRRLKELGDAAGALRAEATALRADGDRLAAEQKLVNLRNQAAVDASNRKVVAYQARAAAYGERSATLNLQNVAHNRNVTAQNEQCSRPHNAADMIALRKKMGWGTRHRGLPDKGETVVVSANINTPAGHVDVRLEKNGRERLACWRAATVIGVGSSSPRRGNFWEPWCKANLPATGDQKKYVADQN